MRGEPWSKDELLLALNYYFKIPLSKIVLENPDIIHLSRILERSTGSVAMKLLNFTSLDPVQRAKGIRGFEHGGKLDAEVWQKYHGNLEALAYESHLALLRLTKHETPEEVPNLSMVETEKELLVKARCVQSFFRDMILANYGKRCSFCGLDIEQLLVASHIIPWKDDEKRRVNPTNGICLCVLHDKAFDVGFLSINSDLKIIVSSELKTDNPVAIRQVGLLAIAGVPIRLPYRFPPAPYALEYHRENIFRP